MRDLFVGEYGLITMGLSYGLAIVLPIIVTFFTCFALLEDSGYLPRLAVMSDRVFRLMGLNGKAVLPMVLGLGCDTMATLTTRILPTRKERLLAMLLLALGVPCSAQLGVILAMLAVVPAQAALVWFAALTGVMLTVGWLAARVLPGERAAFVVELPPMRLPALSNVLSKTAARVEWYLKEALPLFLVGTLVLFLLDRLRLLDGVIRVGEPVVTGILGLPKEASAAFLIGFLRRDFAATRLFDMSRGGALDTVQIVVAMVTITLFIPCIANVFMIAKERGWRTATAMAAFIFPLAIARRRPGARVHARDRHRSGLMTTLPVGRRSARSHDDLPALRPRLPAWRRHLPRARLPDRDRRLRHAALPALRLHDAGRIEERRGAPDPAPLPSRAGSLACGSRQPRRPAGGLVRHRGPPRRRSRPARPPDRPGPRPRRPRPRPPAPAHLR